MDDAGDGTREGPDARCAIIAVPVRARASAVYRFASDPLNLPAWAPGFARSVSRQGGLWIVETADGPVEIAFAPRNALGVLDHRVRLPDGTAIVNPMRVVPNGEGPGGEASVVMFTLFRMEGWDDARMASDAALVRSDLERLAALVSGEPAEGSVDSPG